MHVLSPPRSFCALLLILAACGPVEPSGRSRESSLTQEIIGGTAATDAQVFMLFIRDSNGDDFTCSATLIDNRTLLTAAHCIDVPGLILTASNEPNAGAAPVNTRRPTSLYRWHPEWDRDDPDFSHDLALVLLRDAPGIPPKPWSDASAAGFVGKEVRAVGYGDTSPTSGGSGTRLTVDLVIDDVTEDHLYMGDGDSHGFCYGDSGGPSFHVFPDGVERVVGVHSFVWDETCTYGGDARTDHPSLAAFIRTWLTEQEAACHQDGRCKPGCASPDPDCSCTVDGLCSAACPESAPDPDCVPIGGACEEEAECGDRLCLAEAGGQGAYCSRVCDEAQPCPASLKCEDSACVKPPPGPIRLPAAQARGTSPASCVAAGGSGGAGALPLCLWVIVGTSARWRRRR